MQSMYQSKGGRQNGYTATVKFLSDDAAVLVNQLLMSSYVIDKLVKLAPGVESIPGLHSQGY
jgi:hypothetical protein